MIHNLCDRGISLFGDLIEHCFILHKEVFLQKFQLLRQDLHLSFVFLSFQ